MVYAFLQGSMIVISMTPTLTIRTQQGNELQYPPGSQTTLLGRHLHPPPALARTGHNQGNTQPQHWSHSSHVLCKSTCHQAQIQDWFSFQYSLFHKCISLTLMQSEYKRTLYYTPFLHRDLKWDCERKQN